MKKKKFNLKLSSFFTVLCCLFIGLFLSNISFAQIGDPHVDCTNGCTSNDVQIKTAYFVEPNAPYNPLSSSFQCQGSASVKLALDLTTKTPRVGVFIYAIVRNKNTNALLATVSECFPTPLASGGVTKVVFNQPIGWPCGTPVILTDVFIGWGTGNTDFCQGSSTSRCPATPSKCYSLPPGEYITIQIPLASTASDTECETTPGSGISSFNLTALNGTVSNNASGVTVNWWENFNSSVLSNCIATPGAYSSASKTVYAKVKNNADTTAFGVSPVTLTVNGVTAGSIAASQTICSGATPAAFIVATAATGSGTLSYQWQSGTGTCGTATFSNISGANSATYAPGALTVTTSYRRVDTSTLNNVLCTAISNCITVTVNNITAGSIAGNQTICSGATPAAFTVATAATGSGTLSYQWQSGAGTCATATFSDVSGATSATYAPGALTATTSYRRVATSTLNGVPCAATSNCITVTINNVTAGSIAASQTICSGTTPAAFTVATAATGSGTLSYQWQSGAGTCATATFSDISGATSATHAPGALSATTSYRRVATSTLNGVPCAATSNCITVTISDNPLAPDVTYIPPSCLETTFKVSVDNPQNGSTYTLRQLSGGVSVVTKTAPADVVAGKIVFAGLTVGKGYRVTETTGGGCISSPSACGDFSSVVGAVMHPQTITSEESQTTVKAYPNPFSDKINFVVTSSVAGKGNLDVYNMMGQKIKTVYTGFISAGTQTFELRLPTQQVSNLIYVLRVGDKKMSGKILQINQ